MQLFDSVDSLATQTESDALGHFGRDDMQFPWDDTSKTAALKKAAGLS